MTEDQKLVAGLKHLAKDLGGGVGTMVLNAIRATEREAWLQGFEFGIEMDKAILEIGKAIDPLG